MAALAFWLAARPVDFGAAWAALGQAQWAWVGAVWLAIAVNTLGKVLRWRVLLAAGGQSAPGLLHLLAVFSAGQLLNLVAPGRLGDVSRIFLAGRAPARPVSPGPVSASPTASPAAPSLTLGSLVLEKLLDLAAFGALALSVLAGWLGGVGQAPWADGPLQAAAWVGAGGLLALAALALLQDKMLAALLWLAGKTGPRLAPWLTPRLRAAAGVLRSLQTPGRVFTLTGWTAGVWLAALATNYLALQAFPAVILPPHTPLLAAPALLLLILQLGLTPGLTPGHFGVFELACVLALSAFGVPAAPALAFGLLLHVLLLAWQIATGLPALLWLTARLGRPT